ncbi:YihY/virulence factor BrkB family protein [Streptomyces physcomitrii]|uniref:YihY/virulence factor BrkB family protein n=1 Tax=Streptomyces physcomitrii TaxID=2724184 RepID=UPI00340B1365
MSPHTPAEPDTRPASAASRPVSPFRPGDWARARTALRRVPVRMWNDDVSDHAAALTYYTVLALLPALLTTVSLIGLFSDTATETLIADVTRWAPAESGRTLNETLEQTAQERSAAVTVVIAGFASALWSSSSYLAVFRRALHAMHGIEDHRTPLGRAHRLVLTALALLLLLLSSAVVLVVGGPLASVLSRHLGFGDTGATVWSLLRWPLLVCLVVLLVLILFRSAPKQRRGVRRTLPGGLLAGVLWLVASAAFSLYATGLDTYSRLYGSLAGVIVFLIWLWMANLALLTGAQFTVELHRTMPGEQSGTETPRS